MESEGVESTCDLNEEAAAALEFLTAQVRETLPPGYCIHGEPFCLSCGLERLVARSASAPLASAEAPDQEQVLSAAR